jgi:cysteinyl-tRNA synthetase
MSEGFKGLRLYNTLTRAKEDFVPIDPANVRMYVCGPTVYDYAHIGNARPAIVFDVLYRLLRHLYGADHVTYVRNITDVDDKINARALRDYGAEIAAGRLSLNEAIRKVTEPTYEQYQKDVGALGCLPPTHQPRATEFVLPRADGKADMVTLIQSLIDRGHAYVSNGEVLFDVTSMADYGRLSKRPLDEQQAGARIDVKDHKKNPADFVLWKESSAEEPGWDAHFDLKDGSHVHIHGRPGWHIECSAMSAAYLGEVFDIHGGGLDLIFPHHENEIAQSRCAHGTEVMARYWLHNGFLQVEGRKMSKSEGNFVTIHELLQGVGRMPFAGEVIRLTMLATHYRQPIDFSDARLEHWRSRLAEWVQRFDVFASSALKHDFLVGVEQSPSEEVIAALSDDLGFSGVIAHLERLASEAPKKTDAADQLGKDLVWLGVLRTYLKNAYFESTAFGVQPFLYEKYRDLIPVAQALTLNNYQFQSPSDVRSRSRAELNERFKRLNPDLAKDSVSIVLDEHGGISLVPLADDAKVDEVAVQKVVARRLAFIASKNWAEADRIRDELLAQGIQLKDGKDPATGERITTWEVKR